jgi:chloramphenicol 3-O phosphotransferase
LTPKLIEQIIKSGHNVIIDEIIWENDDLNKYIKTLKAYNVFYVSVDCELSLLERREKERGDRILGQARFQYFKINLLEWKYYLKINSGEKSPLDSAKKILEEFYKWDILKK